jgi:predicted transcriptional regulator of viral defense system
MSVSRNRTTGPLGSVESSLLAKVGHLATFSISDARQALEPRQRVFAAQILGRLREKGWVARVARGRFAVIPLSSGTTGSAQLHECVVAMELARPAAIAYFSALNHHGLTEQLPRTVFVATDHPVRRRQRESLGVTFRIVSVRPHKYFGIQKAWAGDLEFSVTNLEKTIIDALDLPGHAGGVGLVTTALRSHWDRVDETRLRDYARRIGNSAAAKRLGFLMETLGLGDAEALRKAVTLGTGFPRLDPALPPRGSHNRRWGLLLNMKVAP